MRITLLVSGAICFLLCNAFAAAPTPQAKSTLYSEDFLERSTYPAGHDTREKALRRKLAATPFDCGRYIEGREAVLSIYRDRQSNRYFATVINSPSKVPKEYQLYPVGRFDAELPETCALSVREAWRAMLSRPYSDGRLQNKPFVVLDGLDGEYSIKLSQFRTVRGDLPVGMKYWGPHLKQMWTLTGYLFDYCRANSQRRRALAAKIKRQAEAVTQSIWQERRSNQALQPTAGRSEAASQFMKTHPLQATLALASGG